METIVSSSSQNSFSDQIEWILNSFEFYDGVYKRDSVEAAVHLKEEITPHLLGILEDVIRNPHKYTDENLQYQSPFYAAMLLSYFKEEIAHPLFLKSFGLPDGLSSDIFGDLVTGNLPIFLYSTCSRNIEGIKELVLNQQAYSYCRISAAQALVYCVASGYTDRQEILKFFSELFTGEPDSLDGEVLSFIACCMNDLYPDTVMDVIESGYKRDLIFSGIVGKKSFIKTLEVDSPERSLEKVRVKLGREMHENIHDYMEWWACFNKKTDYGKHRKHKSSQYLSAAPLWKTQETIVRSEPKVGRNDPCPCGSGKKYKKCCLH